MERHVRVLAILSRLWGALAMLLGLSLLLLAGGAAALRGQPSGAVGFAAGLTVAIFGLAGVSALLWGGASVWSGWLLHRRLPLGRTLALVLALVNLPVVPFGTALGAYAFWVLLSNDGRRLFESPAVS